VSGAETKDLEAFLEIFDYMGRQEQIMFLKASDEVGTHLGNLVKQSHKLMGQGGKDGWAVPDVHEYADSDYEDSYFGKIMPSGFLGCLEAVDMMRGPMIASYIDAVI
jgi:hypothetical protein